MKKLLILLLLATMILSGCELNINSNDPDVKNWTLMTQSAKGTVVTIAIEHSNPAVLEWFRKDFASTLKLKHEIELVVVDQNILKTLDQLNQEKANEVEMGSIDLIYIESEGFKSAMEKSLLYGPFSDKLPNAELYFEPKDTNYASRDGISANYHMIPVSRKQLSMIYNQDVFYEKPESYDALIEIIKTYKGGFTYPDPRTSIEGQAFVLSVLGQYLDFDVFKSGTLDKNKYLDAIKPGIEDLVAMKPYLMDGGATYPQSMEALDAIFREGKAIMSLSMDYNYVTDRLREYEYPEGASTFVIPAGMATFNEVAAIAFNAPNKSGAMVVLNELLTPEVQTLKYNPRNWGSLPPYSKNLVDTTKLEAFKDVKLKSTTVKLSEFIEASMPEFSPEMIKIALLEWENKVLGNME